MSNKTTKRALWMSALSLVLCFSMLVGTTFAWFTDEVKSGTNTIVAGNLDVDVYYGNPEDENSIQDIETLFNDVKLWEPGALAYEVLTVKNVGTLALKYQLNINFENATVVDGHSLDEALKVAVVEADKLTDREAALAAATGKWQELESFDLSGDLTAQTSKTYGIVIYWEPSDAETDNLFNMNNDNQGKELTIDLGVHLFATQLEAEKDSFDETYDHEAQYYIQPGQTMNFNDKAIEGKVENYGTVNISGGEIVNDSTGLQNYGEATLTDVTMTAGTPGYRGYGYAVNTLEGASTVLNNVTIQSDNGIIGATNGAQVTVNSGEYTLVSANTSGRYVVYAVDQGTVVTINGGEFSIPAKLPNGNNQNMRRAYVYVGEGATVYINGGTFNKYSPNTKKGYGPIMGNGTVIITGGTFGFDPTQWVATGCEVTYDTTAKTWTVKAMSQADANAALSDALAGNATEITVAPGNYTFPASSLSGDETLICAPGTVFEGNSKLNINGATVVGATFSNPTGSAADQTINGTFKDCTFEGTNGLRWCYAGETVVFENCVFSGSVYGVHFDGGANEVIFRNCTFSGFNATAAAVTNITFEGCTFVSNGKSAYNGINLWGNGEFTDCTFVFDGSCTYEWIDLCGADKTATFTNCVVDNGTTVENIETVLGTNLTKRNASGKIIIDGTERTY